MGVMYCDYNHYTIIDRINTTLKDKTAYSTCAQHKIHKPQMNYYKSNETLDTRT